MAGTAHSCAGDWRCHPLWTGGSRLGSACLNHACKQQLQPGLPPPVRKPGKPAVCLFPVWLQPLAPSPLAGEQLRPFFPFWSVLHLAGSFLAFKEGLLKVASP